jgi:hypothetical protein
MVVGHRDQRAPLHRPVHPKPHPRHHEQHPADHIPLHDTPTYAVRLWFRSPRRPAAEFERHLRRRPGR